MHSDTDWLNAVGGLALTLAALLLLGMLARPAGYGASAQPLPGTDDAPPTLDGDRFP